MVTWGTYIAVFGVLLVGSTVQSAAGFGLGLISAPLLRLLHAPLLPGPIVLAGLVVAISVFVRNSRRTDLPVVTPAIAGRIVGTVIAIGLLALLSDRGLSIAIAVVVLGFVALRLAGVQIARTTLTLGSAGVVGGIGGTIAALGGAPMALLYEQHAKARDFRGPMGWYTVVGGASSVALLVIAGELDGEGALLGLALMPPVAIGLVLARWVTPIVDGGFLRPLVLGLSSFSALALLGGAVF